MQENTLTWKLVNLLWVIFSFIFLLNGIGIIYAAYKADNRNWLIEGLIYQAIPTLLLILAIIDPNSSFGVTLAGIYILSWIICIVRTFFIASKYLSYIKTKTDTSYNQYMYQSPNNTAQNDFNNYQPINQNMTFNTNTHENSNPNVNHIVKQRFNHNLESNIDKKKDIEFASSNNAQNNTTPHNFIQEEIPESNNKTSTVNEISTININTATIDEIKQIPYLNQQQAEKIIDLRNNGVTITSFADLKQKLDLNDNQIKQLESYITITNPNSTQRRVDL